MKRLVKVNGDDRISATVEEEKYADETYFEFDFPDDFSFAIQQEYRIVDGLLIHELAPPTEEEIAQENAIKRKRQMDTATIMFVRTNAVNMSDEEAISVSTLFEEWEDVNRCLEGRIYQYKGDIYRCLESHDKQSTWTPDQAHSLFVRVRPEGEILDWKPVQPGINDPYSKGDKVRHNGKTWISDCDNNVWEPGIYGWTEI